MVAVEELSADRAAVEAARPGGHAAKPPGEGCAMFLLESPGSGARNKLAEVLAVEFGMWADPDDTGAALARCLRRALARASVAPEEVCAVAPSPLVGDAERAVAAEIFPEAPILTATLDAVGDTRAVSAAFQIVELLATQGASGRVGVATTVDMEGRVGCALLRMC